MISKKNKVSNQLTDHLGNVRAVVSKDNNGNAAALVSATDYYPGGMPMPGRQFVNGKPYRYGYQGEFAETDEETGKPAFQLRLYDLRINRWLSPDPMRQYHSPYMAMGDNPISRIDPDGGTDCPDPPCTGITNELPGFSLSFQGGDGLQNLDFDMNMYGRAGSMWNEIDWQEVYKPQIDEMIASMHQMQNEFLSEFGQYLSVVSPWSFAIGGAVNVSANVGKYGFTRFVGQASNNVFWSGGSKIAGEAAKNYATVHGLRTLEMTIQGKALTRLTSLTSYKLTKPIWNYASKQFAKDTHGKMHVFLNAKDGVRINSIWSKIEFPILNNKNIIYHNIFK